MFSKKITPDYMSEMVTPMVSSNGRISGIGADVTIRGNIDSHADLEVDGTIFGDINCPTLIQGETSHIEGAIRAERARLSGAVKGTVYARELVLLETARIEGDVQYQSLVIERGARVEGSFAPASGLPGESHIEEVVDASYEDDEDDDLDLNHPRLTLSG